MHVEIYQDESFEAAHHLPHVPDGHMCKRLHGHSYRVRLWCAGEVDPRTGWLIDYADISRAWRPLHAQLDHRLLNDIEGLANPTTENLCKWIWDRLVTFIPVSKIEVRETAAHGCVYRGQ